MSFFAGLLIGAFIGATVGIIVAGLLARSKREGLGMRELGDL